MENLNNITLINNTGSHDVVVYAGCTENPANRKMMGGREVARIPFSGQMLGVKKEDQTVAVATIGGAEVPVVKRVVTAADPVPEDGAYHVVSALYAAGLKELGMDTSRILTTGDPVVAEDGRTILGCCKLVTW